VLRECSDDELRHLLPWGIDLAINESGESVDENEEEPEVLNVDCCYSYLLDLLKVKRTSDCGESYFEDMWKMVEKQHTPILMGLRSLTEERGWEVEVVPLVSGQWSVRDKECLESLRIFGIGKEDGQWVIGRLVRTLLDEHEKFYRSGPPGPQLMGR
jgi:hypothetical protein